jgi:hypothetical protein
VLAGKTISYSRKYQLLRPQSEDGDEIFDTDVMNIFYHLLEILGVSIDTDFKAICEQMDKSRNDKAALLTSRLI